MNEKPNTGKRLEKTLILSAALIFIAFILIFLVRSLGGMSSGSDDESVKKRENTEKEFIADSELESVYEKSDDYIGKYATITGQVYAVTYGDEEFFYIQMYHDVENKDDNTFVRAELQDTTIESGDFVTVVGEILGTFEYKSEDGDTVVALTIDADSVEKSE